jgi:hypothetical protein
MPLDTIKLKNLTHKVISYVQKNYIQQFMTNLSTFFMSKNKKETQLYT